MRRTRAIAAGLSLLLLTATACSGNNDSTGGASSSKSIKIGMDLDLSGPFSIGGQGALKGIRAYFDAANKSGGIAGRQVQLVTLDSVADVNRALSNVQQLINQDKVDALLGVSVSSISEALNDVVTDAKIPLVSVAAAPSQIFPKPSDWVVMAQSVQNQQVGPTVELIKDLVPKPAPKVAYIHFDSAAQHGFGDGLTKAVQQRGWTLAAKEIVPLTASPDIRAQASKLVAAQPDVVVSLMTDKNSKLLQETLRVQGFKGPIIQNPDTGPDILNQITDPNFYLMTHSYIDNTASDKIAGDENWAKMKRAFDAASLPVGTPYAVRGYLNALVLGTALEKCGGCTGEKLREALVGATVPANGITPGDLSFSADNHQGVKGVPIYRQNNGLELVGDFKTGTGITS